jgi:signal transduction histidine kinase
VTERIHGSPLPTGPTISSGRPSEWPLGGGELGSLIRAFDWSATSLGPKDDWPQSLKTAVDILLQSPVPIVMLWGPDGVMIYNDAYSGFAGARHPRLLGSKVLEGWPEVADFNANVMRVGLGGGTLAYRDQHLVLYRHGVAEDVWMNLDYSPVLNEDGVPAGVLAIVVETTGRVMSERRLRTLREIGSRTAGLGDVDAVCRAAVEAMAQNPGDIPAASLHLLRGGDEAVLVASHGGAMGDDAADSGQLVLPVTSGDTVVGLLRVRLEPHLESRSDYRDFLQLVATQVSMSVAAARALEEERQRVESLAALDRAKTQFFSNVSHEFRTPLTLMLGPTQDALADPGLSGANRERLELVHRNALRLLELVNTLLDFSRIEAGRIDAVYEATDLAAYTTELAGSFRSVVESAGLRLVIDAPPLAQPVYVDRDMWEKIVLNLLSNAFKHTFAGEIVVRVRDAGDRAEVSVADTGVGIPADQLPRVFERFHRVPSARSRSHEGTGIGLALVHELVRLHAGEIGVTSELDAGTTFTVCVPFGTTHLPADRIAGATRSAGAPLGSAAYVADAQRWLPPSSDGAGADGAEGGDLAGAEVVARWGRVLVADDNADMRGYAARLLRREGWAVEAVADGRAALEAARERRPDLVLSDVMMPNLDGIGLLRALRADPATMEIPVILLSARAGEDARVEGLSAGADDYLPKPFSARELVARVGATLHLARLRKEAEAARRETEERFRALVTASSDVVYRMSPDWSELRQLRGRDFIADADGPSRTWLETYLHPDDRAHVLEAIAHAVRTRSPFELEHRVVRIDGTLGWTFSRAIPLIDASGQIVEWIGMASDVTRRKLAEEALIERTAQAQAANQAKSDFLAAMSHELRTPLNAITGYVQLLEIGIHGPVPDAQREVLARVQRSGHHLLSLINDVLNFAKLEAGRVEYYMDDVVLADAIRAVLPMVESSLAAKELACETNVAPDVVVRADPDKLQQILLNLLSNAVKFTPTGGRITVDTGWRDGAPEGFAFVRVSDTGIGIPRDKLEAVFDPFIQVHRNLTRTTEGTGLGLSISRDLARGMGGDLRVRSEEGRGSTFTLALREARADR